MWPYFSSLVAIFSLLTPNRFRCQTPLILAPLKKSVCCWLWGNLLRPSFGDSSALSVCLSVCLTACLTSFQGPAELRDRSSSGWLSLLTALESLCLSVRLQRRFSVHPSNQTDVPPQAKCTQLKLQASSLFSSLHHTFPSALYLYFPSPFFLNPSI